ncbi:3-deoxy-manno-octulosonate cytidylyltransferase [Thiohalorhabdus sp.]|uniref:3-deoxy-manno-octulosonate cytidylyltransferase n=1 Tax=Thiohalorhabdus sp. TaxID=3094134 RepID=UPI002FC33A31
MSFTVLIPARYQASRLPGKPLRDVGGLPLVCRVLERAAASGAHRVAVATDDERVAEAVRAQGGEAVMTGADCASGTDRLAEAAAAMELPESEPVVNLQGDEPFISSELIRAVATALDEGEPRDMATAGHPAEEWQNVLDPHVVKVVRSASGDALYFSRAPIPWAREAFGGGTPAAAELAEQGPPAGYLLHVGIYAYRTAFLAAFSRWTATPLERRESLEQLRALENGVPIRVVDAPGPPAAGVDTAQDLERARERFL